MRITREKAAENRARVVTAAASLFREKGVEGVGVDTVAKAAGLTHGAVYSHFGSKGLLAAEAVRQAIGQSMAEWLQLTEGRPGVAAFEKLAKAYVSRAHRDHPEAGCSLAALGSEALRSGPDVHGALGDGVLQFLDILTAVSEKAMPSEGRREAILRAAAMAGAVVLARAAASNQKLSDEILKSVREGLLAT